MDIKLGAKYLLTLTSYSGSKENGMNLHKKKLDHKELDKFFLILRDIASNSRFPECENFIQHGNTTVKKHCIRVAATAYFIALKLGIRVNERELIRGALLHDYFMYDWHNRHFHNGMHGFTHPRTALKEALKDFTLSSREQNMILRHMFPLTPCPPKYREGWILCLADKICAANETIRRK